MPKPQPMDESSSRVAELEQALAERSRDLEARLEVERRFHALFAALGDSALLTRMRDGAILDVNAASEAVTGYTGAGVRGRTTLELGLWPLPEERAAMVQELRREGQVTGFPIHFRRRDGTVRKGRLNASVIGPADDPVILSVVEDVTDHESAAQALRMSESRLRQIIDLVPHFIFAKDAEGRFILVNRAVAEAYGTTVEELTGRTDADFASSEEEVRHFRADDAEVIESGRPKVIPEETITDATGRPRLLQTTKIPFTFSGTDTAAMLGVSVDITDRRRAEMARLESEELYRRLFETAGDAILLMRGNEFVDCNLRALEMFGATREQLLGRPPTAFSPERQPGDRLSTELAAERIEAAFRGRPQRFEWTHQRLDGAPFPAEVTLNHLQLAAGPHLLAIVRDVSQSKRAIAALERSEAQLRLLADNVADILWTVDLDLRLTYVSPAIRRMHGGEPSDWIGKPPHSFIAPDSLTIAIETLGREIAEFGHPGADPTHTVTLELEQLRLDGSTFWTEVTASLLRDAEGRPVGAIGVTRDISERREAQERHRRLEEQLVHSQKMQSIGRLAGGIAHDINNMLTPILGHTDLLRQELSTDDVRRNRVVEILAAAERCRDLVRRLLAFARKQNLEMVSLDLNELVSGFHRMLRRTLREDITLAMRLSPEPVVIEGDGGQIEQVLLNLAINAQDAMPSAGTLTMELSRVDAGPHPDQEPAGPCVLLRVQDTGTGMDEATRSRLFEPFFTTKALGHGTGLGLSTVYGIVRQHRGSIEVESAPGRGTEFRIYLPRSEGVPGTRNAPARVSHGVPGRGTVLVVEDEPQVRSLTVEVLRSAGYVVLEASDARSALALAEKHTGALDLLLTDVVLPDENGRRLHQRILARHPSLRALFMSGYSADVISAHGVLEAGLHYIQKPFTVHALTTKIAETLGRN